MLKRLIPRGMDHKPGSRTDPARHLPASLAPIAAKPGRRRGPTVDDLMAGVQGITGEGNGPSDEAVRTASLIRQ